MTLTSMQRGAIEDAEKTLPHIAAALDALARARGPIGHIGIISALMAAEDYLRRARSQCERVLTLR